MVCEGSAQPVWGLARLRLGLAAAWPYPPSGTLAFCPRPIHTQMATELAPDRHHPQHRRAPYALRPWPRGGRHGERNADTAWCLRQMCVTSGLSPVPLCPVCTQMSMNAARRTGGATRYATTSQAASTVPATAAMSSPGTTGAAKVKPGAHPGIPHLAPPLPAPSSRLLPSSTFAIAKLLKLAVTLAPLQEAVGSGCRFGSGREGRREEGFCRRSTCPGMPAPRGSCPAPSRQHHRRDESLCLWTRPAPRRWGPLSRGTGAAGPPSSATSLQAFPYS